MLLITESWLQKRDQKKRGDLTPVGYDLKDIPRDNRIGGGIAVVYKANIKVELIQLPPLRSYVETHHLRFWLYTVRPKAVKRKKIPLSLFYDEFSSILERLLVVPEDIIICGDLNLHVNDPTDAEAMQFLNYIDVLDLSQHVRDPTLISGNTLDHVITRKAQNIIRSFHVDIKMSDHSVILMTLNLQKPEPLKKVLTFRTYKNIDMDKFRCDVSESLADLPLDTLDTDTLVSTYNSVLVNTLDQHAPIQRREVIVRHHTPWRSADLSAEKRALRKAERRSIRTRQTVDRDIFNRQRSLYNSLLDSEKTTFYSNMVFKNSHNPNALFKILNTLLHRKPNSPLPPPDDPIELAKHFSDYFIGKIQKIRDELDGSPSQTLASTENEIVCDTEFNEFSSVTEDHVKKLIQKAPCKSCDSDPIPTWMLHLCLDELLPLITKVINSSKTTAVMPDDLKFAMLRPLLKKFPSSFQFDLHELLQSAYKKAHSTETALLKVQDDLLMKKDTQHVSILILLDLSAAFDTIDHCKLLQRLSQHIGVKGTALQWFQSYLSDRKQAVKIGEAVSDSKPLTCGVPQGSVLGPILFTIYTLPLDDILRCHGMGYHMYADDTQLYLSFKAG